jgi:hypothetical protein
MKHKLKSIIKSSPSLYKLWFIIIRSTSSNLRLPKKTDHYYLDGYPRSGNTYLRGLLNYIVPEKRGAHHLHVIAGIKLAKARKISPIIILIRNPKDAILSNLYRKVFHTDNPNKTVDDRGLLSELIDDWITYYSFVAKSQNIDLIDFAVITEKTDKTIRNILVSLKCSNLDVEKSIEEYTSLIKLNEKNKEVAAGSLPNKSRDEFKDAYSNIIEEFPSFDDAVKLYKKLTE